MRFDTHPTGMEFQIFGTPHLVALGIILALNLAIPLMRRLGEPGQRWIRYGVAAAMMAFKVADNAWRVRNGLWNIRDDLPLHLCTLMCFVSAALLVTRSRTLYDFVYFLGLGGSLEALVTPDLGAFGYPHLYFFASFIEHGGIIFAGLYMTVVEGYRPTWRTLWRVAGCMAVYTGAVMLINARLGSNYLWVGHKPEFPTLIDLLGPWPWYVLSLVGVGIVSMVLLYLPFAWSDWRRHRATRARALI